MKNFILSFILSIGILYIIFTFIAESLWIFNWSEDILEFYVISIGILFIIMVFGYLIFNKDISNRDDNPYLM